MRPSVVLPLLLLLGCEDIDGTSELLLCDLDTGNQVVPTDMTIEFSLRTTGDGYASSLLIRADGGVLPVARPVAPYVLSLPVTQGTLVGMSADASAGNGTVTIGYRATSDGSQLRGSDSCSFSGSGARAGTGYGGRGAE